MEYTKGEWKYIPGSEDYIDKKGKYKDCFSGVIHGGKLDMALCLIINDCVDDEANARLIAAAPDMYEALKLYQEHQEGTSGHYCYKCAEAINTALAKAEGKGE